MNEVGDCVIDMYVDRGELEFVVALFLVCIMIFLDYFVFVL